jgi:hypothetical protein
MTHWCIPSTKNHHVPTDQYSTLLFLHVLPPSHLQLWQRIQPHVVYSIQPSIFFEPEPSKHIRKKGEWQLATQSVQVKKHKLQGMIARLHSLFCTQNRTPSLQCVVMLITTSTPEDANRDSLWNVGHELHKHRKISLHIAAVIASNQNCISVSQQVQHVVMPHLLITKIISVSLGNRKCWLFTKIFWVYLPWPPKL